jgi:hypothetical protein
MAAGAHELWAFPYLLWVYHGQQDMKAQRNVFCAPWKNPEGTDQALVWAQLHMSGDCDGLLHSILFLSFYFV